jgi:hypothetical protein
MFKSQTFPDQGLKRKKLIPEESKSAGRDFGRSGEGANFFQEAGGGESIQEFDTFDASPSGFDFRAAYNLIAGPVSALHENIGKESGDLFLWGWPVEDEDRVDTFETGEDLGALLLRNDGTRGTFEGANTLVAVNPDDQKITEGPGRFKATDVAWMKQIEAAIGKDNLATVAFLPGKPQNRFFQSEHRWMQGNSMFDRSERASLQPEIRVYHYELVPRRGTWLSS